MDERDLDETAENLKDIALAVDMLTNIERVARATAAIRAVDPAILMKTITHCKVGAETQSEEMRRGMLREVGWMQAVLRCREELGGPEESEQVLREYTAMQEREG